MCFQYFIVSRPSLATALSVVSMELSLHRIAEIRPGTWHRGGPGYEKSTFISVLFVSSERWGGGSMSHLPSFVRPFLLQLILCRYERYFSWNTITTERILSGIVYTKGRRDFTGIPW